MVPPLTLCANMKKGPNLRWSLIQCSGGDEGDRTPDLLTASQALSQLSYAPVRRSTIRELGPRCKDNFGKTFRRGVPAADPGRPEAGRTAFYRPICKLYKRKKARHSAGLLEILVGPPGFEPRTRGIMSPPALTVAPRALVVSGCDSNVGYPFALVLHHEEKYYHARDGRSTHDLVDKEDHGAAFDLVFLYEKRPQLALEPHSMLGWRRGGIEPLTS